MLLCQMCTKVVQVSGKNVSVQMYCHKANERKRDSRQKITTSLEVAAFEVLLDAWHRQIFFWWKEGGNVIWCLLQEDHPLRLAGLIEIFPDCHLWEGRWVGMMLSHEPVPYRDFSGDGLGSYHSQFYFFFSPVLFSYTAEDLMLSSGSLAADGLDIACPMDLLVSAAVSLWGHSNEIRIWIVLLVLRTGVWC